MITRVRITGQNFVNRWIRGNQTLTSLKNKLNGLGLFDSWSLALFVRPSQKERPPFQATPIDPVSSAFKYDKGAYLVILTEESPKAGGINSSITGEKAGIERPASQEPSKGTVHSAFKYGGDAYWGIKIEESPKAGKLNSSITGEKAGTVNSVINESGKAYWDYYGKKKPGELNSTIKRSTNERPKDQKTSFKNLLMPEGREFWIPIISRNIEAYKRAKDCLVRETREFFMPIISSYIEAYKMAKDYINGLYKK